MLWKMGLFPRYSSVLPCSIFTDLRIIGPYRATPVSARRAAAGRRPCRLVLASHLSADLQASAGRANENHSEFNGGAAAFRFKLTSKVRPRLIVTRLVISFMDSSDTV